jgi:hypothetical protein
MNERYRQLKRYGSILLVPLIGGSVILTGCGTTTASVHKILHATTARRAVSIASLPQIQITHIQGHDLTGYRYRPDQTVVHLTIIPSTKIWDNGKMILYSQAPSLKAPETISIRYQSQAPHDIKNIYGPWQHLSGIIQRVSHASVTIRTTRPAMDPPGTPFTPQRLTLAFNATSNFSGTSSASLRPGRRLDAQVIGDSKTTLFIVTASLYRQKGSHQWTQIGSPQS